MKQIPPIATPNLGSVKFLNHEIDGLNRRTWREMTAHLNRVPWDRWPQDHKDVYTALTLSHTIIDGRIATFI